MSLFLWSVFFTIVFFSGQSYAQSYPIKMNFQKVKEATSYDVRAVGQSPYLKGKVKRVHLKTNRWKGSLPSGKWKLYLRSRDKRGVPGLWSTAIPYTSSLPNTEWVDPPNKLKSKRAKEYPLPLKWKPIGSKVYYNIVIKSKDSKFKKNLQTQKSRLYITVPVAENLEVTITPSLPDKVLSKDPLVGQFFIEGPPLMKPRFLKKSGNTIQWKKVPFAEDYEVLVFVGEQEEPILKSESLKDKAFILPEDSEAGTYTVKVRSKAPRRAPSNYSESTLEYVPPKPIAIEGEREQKTYHFFYYASTSYEETTVTSSNSTPFTSYSLGGEDIIGATYRLNPKWSLTGQLGIHTMSVNDTDFVSPYIDAHGTYHWRFSPTFGLEASVGLHVKSTTEVLPEGDGFKSVRFDNAGLNGKLSFNTYITHEWQLKFLAQTYLLAPSAPSGYTSDQTSAANRLGVLGEARIWKIFGFHMGVIYENLELRYNSESESRTLESQRLFLHGGGFFEF